MTNISIRIDCACGSQHQLPLDASGHFSGPLPCDPTSHAELQVRPSEWRAMVEREQRKVTH